MKWNSTPLELFGMSEWFKPLESDPILVSSNRKRCRPSWSPATFAVPRAGPTRPSIEFLAIHQQNEATRSPRLPLLHLSRFNMTNPTQDRAPGTSEFVIYTGDDGKAHVQIRLEEGSVWMTQRQIAEAFGVSVPTIHEHLAGIYVEEELDPARTIRQARIVQIEGKRSVSRLVEQYALPAIMAIGYRVRSMQGNIFRHWVTERLNESLARGDALDEERLKSNGDPLDDHLNELTERIREIPVSERRFHLKKADVNDQSSVDDEPNSPSDDDG